MTIHATIELSAIRGCLEGMVPSMMATCAQDGTPNVAYLSQVCYVDDRHVALSFQFFNKTRQNILANPHAAALVMHPRTAAFYRLHLHYLRTETSGPTFESMKAQLAGIASHSGMAGVFKLLGADIYEVLSIECVDGSPLPAPPAPAIGLLGALRRSAERLMRCSGTDELLQATLATLHDQMDVQHAMVLMLDANAHRLYTVASAGYATSGVGSEIEMGHGVIGVAARECTPVRISHMTNAASYSHAVRSSMQLLEPGLALDTDIPYPGLPEPHSQLAVPIVSTGRLLGVLFVESPLDMRFGYEDEDAMVAIAGQLGAALELLQNAAEPAGETPSVQDAAPPRAQPAPGAAALELRHYRVNDSVFIDGQYLIKGVAGAILWKLLRDHAGHGRSEFSNRELRLDPSIGLPDVADNLEARLVLLQRRLVENSPHIRIEKTGRGRFRLRVERAVNLVEMG
ncbi:GAF domain-containing protein [Variovorax sp. dw_308]|uniref:GAF domain-containing protein n=1 Tax=Variovorax sp. dw_308 TaxID=2721546 RepID=UPI001C44BDB0|nr:GAF domain-containing protein [Variovorax sp. dw_308]